MNTTPRPASHAAILARLAPMSTPMLWKVAADLDARGETKGPEERLVAALVADELTERLGLDDALDAIFDDDAFEGTYYEAMRKAEALVGA